MSDFVPVLRTFAIAVLISFSVAVGTAALGTASRAAVAPAPVAVAMVAFPDEANFA